MIWWWEMIFQTWTILRGGGVHPDHNSALILSKTPKLLTIWYCWLLEPVKCELDLQSLSNQRVTAQIYRLWNQTNLCVGSQVCSVNSGHLGSCFCYLSLWHCDMWQSASFPLNASFMDKIFKPGILGAVQKWRHPILDLFGPLPPSLSPRITFWWTPTSPPTRWRHLWTAL